MKKRLISLFLATAIAAGLLVGCGGKDNKGKAPAAGQAASWKVTCPWAPSGVAAMVSQKTAAKSTQYSKNLTLVAEALPGDAATVNTWVMDTDANESALVFAGEGLLAITAIIDPAKLQFKQDDFVFVENLYSSIFVLSSDAKLNIKTLSDLEAYVKDATEISVAVNGATGSEAFLAASLFGKMDAGSKLKLVAYQSANEAAQALAKGETQFAVSHQSQILETVQQGHANVVCAFDEKPLANGPFAGVEGVGAKGYPFFRNRCFIMARAGTAPETVAELKTLYDQILADKEVDSWLRDTMLLEPDTMSPDEVTAHIENVKSIVNEYKVIVAG